MRSTLTAVIVGLTLAAAAAAPSSACPFQDQARADTQQQTAQAQPAQPSQTSTQ